MFENRNSNFLDAQEKVENSSEKSPVNFSPSFSRDEMNLAEFPLAVLSTRSNPQIKTLEFSDTQRLKSGELIERKWIITGADKFGLPTSTDDDVVLGLIKLTMAQGFRDRKVHFTRYELLKALRWSTEGKSYKRLIKSLDRLSGARIRASNAFYDNTSKAHQTVNFGIIDAYEINDGRGAKSINEECGGAQSFFIWSEVLFSSFQAGFIKKLDLDLYFNLSSAVSRRLYRYLDKHFYFRPSVERKLLTFAFEKLGLSRNYKYVSSVKQQLQSALEELKSYSFLEHYEYQGRGEETTIKLYAKKEGHKPTLLPQSQVVREFKKGSETKVERPILRAVENEELIEALVSRGISLVQARRLLLGKSKGESLQIENILRYYDDLVEKKDHKVSRNRVGFLYRAVENPFAMQVPQSFIEKPSSRYSEEDSEQLRNPRGRPELKIFSSKKTNVTSKKGETSVEIAQKTYRLFVAKEVDHYLSKMRSEDILHLRQFVENKVKYLRNILTEDKFREAIEACVRDEIATLCGLPDFKQWLKKIKTQNS